MAISTGATQIVYRRTYSAYKNGEIWFIPLASFLLKNELHYGIYEKVDSKGYLKVYRHLATESQYQNE